MAKRTKQLQTLWWDWLSTAERLLLSLHEQTAALSKAIDEFTGNFTAQSRSGAAAPSGRKQAPEGSSAGESDSGAAAAGH